MGLAHNANQEQLSRIRTELESLSTDEFLALVKQEAQERADNLTLDGITLWKCKTVV